VQVPDISGFENAALRRAHKWKFHVTVQLTTSKAVARMPTQLIKRSEATMPA